MTEKVTLTEKQEVRLEETILSWRDEVAFNTSPVKPAGRRKAEAGIRYSYEKSGFDAPKHIVWSKSPLAMGAAIFIWQVMENNYEYEASSFSRNAEDGLDGVRADIRDKVDEYFSLHHETAKASRAAKEEAFPDMDMIVETALDYGPNFVTSSTFWGNQDTDWLAYFSFIRDELKMTEFTEPSLGQMDVARNAGWWCCYDSVAFVSERASVIGLDPNAPANRVVLHGEDGPGIGYPDQWNLYSWHGVRVPSWYIEHKERIDLKAVKDENNSERRRVLTEIWGLDNYVKALGVDSIWDDKWGQLYVYSSDEDQNSRIQSTLDVYRGVAAGMESDDVKRLFRERQTELVVVVKDHSTERIYALPVAPLDPNGDPILNSKQAIASTWGKTEAEYNPSTFA